MAGGICAPANHGASFSGSSQHSPVRREEEKSRFELKIIPERWVGVQGKGWRGGSCLPLFPMGAGKGRGGRAPQHRPGTLGSGRGSHPSVNTLVAGAGGQVSGALPRGGRFRGPRRRCDPRGARGGASRVGKGRLRLGLSSPSTSVGAPPNFLGGVLPF